MRVSWMRTVVAGVTVAAAMMMGACSSGDAPKTPTTSPGVTGGVTVFAAASLTESFKTIGKEFEAANPGAKVTFNFAGSSALATQITQGAPADIFAAASPATMKTVTDAGDGAGSPVVFVKNQLVIAVPKGNPKGISTLENLAKADLKVALCAEQVPCGATAKKAIDAAGIKITPVTLEQDVKAALGKVKLGEVDAALVYRTDTIAAAADIQGIEFPESAEAFNDYSIIVLSGAPGKTAAQAFLAWVLSDKGKAVLSRAGFLAP